MSGAESDDDVDQYGNPLSGDRIINCCFPDCGCDGARLCAAERGPSYSSRSLNIEFGGIEAREAMERAAIQSTGAPTK